MRCTESPDAVYSLLERCRANASVVVVVVADVVDVVAVGVHVAVVVHVACVVRVVAGRTEPPPTGSTTYNPIPDAYDIYISFLIHTPHPPLTGHLPLKGKALLTKMTFLMWKAFIN